MNWLKNSWIFLLVILLSFTNTFSQSVGVKESHILEFSWANDFIFGTDYYYTNGLELKYYAPIFAKSPVRYIMLPHKKDELVWHGITLTQHFFTPKTKSNDQSEYDRPFASYLLLGHQKISSNPIKGVKKQSEFQIGLLGKYSGGESIQNGIHEILPTSEPVSGWNNQLSPDLAINYKVKVEYGLLQKQNLEIISNAALNMGIPYTDFGAGIKFRTGKLNNYFSDIGIDQNKPWQLYFFADINGKYVAYNGTIQGGLFNDHIHVVNDINNWIFGMNTGIVFTRKNIGVEFGQQFTSPEVRYGGAHLWGYLTFRFSF